MYSSSQVKLHVLITYCIIYLFADVYDTMVFQEDHKLSYDANGVKVKSFSIYMTWIFDKMLKDEMKCIQICKEAGKIYNQIRKVKVHYEPSTFRSDQIEDTLDASILVSISFLMHMLCRIRTDA